MEDGQFNTKIADLIENGFASNARITIEIPQPSEGLLHGVFNEGLVLDVQLTDKNLRETLGLVLDSEDELARYIEHAYKALQLRRDQIMLQEEINKDKLEQAERLFKQAQAQHAQADRRLSDSQRSNSSFRGTSPSPRRSTSQSPRRPSSSMPPPQPVHPPFVFTAPSTPPPRKTRRMRCNHCRAVMNPQHYSGSSNCPVRQKCKVVCGDEHDEDNQACPIFISESEGMTDAIFAVYRVQNSMGVEADAVDVDNLSNAFTQMRS
jgi:hypothetical protein